MTLGALGQSHRSPHLLRADRTLNTALTHGTLPSTSTSVLDVLGQHGLDVLQVVVRLLEQLPLIQMTSSYHLVQNFHFDFNFDCSVILQEVEDVTPGIVLNSKITPPPPPPPPDLLCGIHFANPQVFAVSLPKTRNLQQTFLSWEQYLTTIPRRPQTVLLYSHAEPGLHQPLALVEEEHTDVILHRLVLPSQIKINLKC